CSRFSTSPSLFRCLNLVRTVFGCILFDPLTRVWWWTAFQSFRARRSIVVRHNLRVGYITLCSHVGDRIDCVADRGSETIVERGPGGVAADSCSTYSCSHPTRHARCCGGSSSGGRRYP